MMILSILGKVPFKVWLQLLAGFSLIVIMTLGYIHYKGLVHKIEVLQANEIKYETAIDLQRRAVRELKGVAGEWKQRTDQLVNQFTELQKQSEKASEETRRLNVLFAEHDLTRLARAKPGLIERRINDGTANAFRMLECKTSPSGCSTIRGGSP